MKWGTEEFQLLYKGFSTTSRYLDNHAATVGHRSRGKRRRLNVIAPHVQAS